MSTATMTPTTTNDPWQMKVSTGGGGDFVACPAGNHPGTIVGLFDIGTQDESYQGQAKQLRKLVLVYELARKKPDGKPFVLGEEFTWSLTEKAKFRKMVESVTGRKFKDGESYDPRQLVGAPVMVMVTNTQNGEKTYHNVASVSQFPDGFPAPTPTYSSVVWSVLANEPWPAGLEWLPYIYGNAIKEMAEDCRERRGAIETAAGTTTPPSPAAGQLVPRADGSLVDPSVDDIPF